MALVDNFAAGRYAATWNAADVGLTQEGISLDLSSTLQDISPSDLYGETVIDGLYRGANCFAQWNFMRWTANMRAALWPWGNLGIVFSATVVAGKLASDVAQALVLTAQTGSPAATEGPATLTASKALLASNFNTQILLDSRLRTPPCRMRFYPYTSAANVIHFSTT